jgi:broad specificity phosphatase PhoE
MKLFLMRHFPHSGNKSAYFGSTDLSLKDQNQRLIDITDEIDVYASPLLRCKESAHVIGLHDPVILQDAREIDFGEWEGLTFEEISHLYPKKVDEWAKKNDFRFPGGEALLDFGNRVQNLFTYLMSKNRDALLITHGGVIRWLICYALGLITKNYLCFKVDLGSLSCIEIFPQGKGVLNFLNNKEIDTWARLFL